MHDGALPCHGYGMNHGENDANGCRYAANDRKLKCCCTGCAAIWISGETPASTMSSLMVEVSARGEHFFLVILDFLQPGRADGCVLPAAIFRPDRSDRKCLDFLL